MDYQFPSNKEKERDLLLISYFHNYNYYILITCITILKIFKEHKNNNICDQTLLVIYL